MQAGRYIVPSRGDCLPRSPSLCICYHTDAFDVDDNRRNGKHKVMQALAAQSREFEEYARGQRRNGGSFEGAKKVRRGWIAPIKLNNALLDLWSTDLSPLRPTMAGFKEEHGASLITAIRRPADTMRRRPKNSREQAGTSGKGVPQAECRRPCEPISNLSSPLSLAVNDPRARPLPPSGKGLEDDGRRRHAETASRKCTPQVRYAPHGERMTDGENERKRASPRVESGAPLRACAPTPLPRDGLI